MMLNQLDIHMENVELNHFLYITHTKIVFQEDYSHKCATFLEINEFEVGNNFLNKGVG